MTYWRTRPISMMEDPNYRPLQRLSDDSVAAATVSRPGKPGKPGKVSSKSKDVGVDGQTTTTTTAATTTTMAGLNPNRLSRPQVYVHLEFGVSWSQRHIPNSHSVTYESAALRNRLSVAPAFPREVPPPNTNYLVDSAPALSTRAPEPEAAAAAAAAAAGRTLPVVPARVPIPPVTPPRSSSLPLPPTTTTAAAAATTTPSGVPHPTYSDYYYYQHQRPRMMQQLEQQQQIDRRSERHAVWNAMDAQRQHDAAQRHRHHNHHSQPHQHRSQNSHQRPHNSNPNNLHSQDAQVAYQPLSTTAAVPAGRNRGVMMPLVEEESRSSRDDRSSHERHERGHSAPPPLSDSPWDVMTPPSAALMPGEDASFAIPVGGSASNFAIDRFVGNSSSNFASNFASGPPPVVPSWTGNHALVSSSFAAVPAGAPFGAAASAPAQIWKDLPEVPSRYRLGEDSLPWSQGGQVEPIADPDDTGYHPRAQPQYQPYFNPAGAYISPRRQMREATRAAIESSSVPFGPREAVPYSNKPTVLPIQPSPTQQLQHSNADPQRFRELESLSAAMMTIDNGFENQWWNQGERVPVANTSGGPDASPANANSGPTGARPARMSSSALPISTPEEDAAMGRVSYLQSARTPGPAPLSAASSAIASAVTALSAPTSPAAVPISMQPPTPPRLIQQMSSPLPTTTMQMPPTAIPATSPQPLMRTTSLGWAIASPEASVSAAMPSSSLPNMIADPESVVSRAAVTSPNHSRVNSHTSNAATMLVSPVSEFSGNAPLAHAPLAPGGPTALGWTPTINRSMSTRSEELFLSGERYA